MKLGTLYEKVKKFVEEDKMPLDTPVIYEGEYGYGDDLGQVYKATRSYISEEIKKEDVDVIAFSVEAYVYEPEDVGYCSMWVDSETKEQFKEMQEEE